MNSGQRIINFGIIGLGRAANVYHAPALAMVDGARLWSVLGRTCDQVLRFARSHGVEHTSFTTLSDFLNDPELDAVLIATRDHSHADLAIAAARAGKAVFIEKPVASTVADAKLVLDAVNRAKVIAGVCYHLRHHRGLQRMVSMLHAGAIGSLRHMRVQWSWRSPNGADHWRSKKSGASWWSLGLFGTHQVDLIRWTLVPLCGEVVRSEGIVSSSIWGAENEETGVLLLQFESGATAEVISSVAFQSESRVEVFGDQGSAVALGAVGVSGGGNIRVGDAEIKFPCLDPYMTQIEEFSSCIRDCREPAVNCAEGLRNVEILEQFSRCS